jgi:hypothetical protein
MSERTAIKLKYPITVDGTETEALYMRRAKVRDQLLVDKASAAGKSAAEKEVLLFANLCEVAPEAISELDMADYKHIQDAYSDFLEG